MPATNFIRKSPRLGIFNLKKKTMHNMAGTDPEPDSGEIIDIVKPKQMTIKINKKVSIKV